MKKVTLQFNCLADIATFTRKPFLGYFINTCNNTVPTKLSDIEIEQASILFKAYAIETTEKVYSYK